MDYRRPLPGKEKIRWPDESEFFLTSSTYLHYPYFKTEEQKNLCLNKIKQIARGLPVQILAYSIAINHLHLKFYLKNGRDMAKVKNILHSGISREYRRLYELPREQFWQPDRTYLIKDEHMSWKITGYIIGNLLKHKEVSTFNDLLENPFSSFKHTAEKFGLEAAKDLVYRVIDVQEGADCDIDLDELKEISLGPRNLPKIF